MLPQPCTRTCRLRLPYLQPAASAPGDATEQLDQLDDLRTRGAITDDEFEAKKAELFNRM